MSTDAKTLLYWVSNAECCAAIDPDESAYCYNCARKWAAYIIAGN